MFKSIVFFLIGIVILVFVANVNAETLKEQQQQLLMKWNALQTEAELIDRKLEILKERRELLQQIQELNKKISAEQEEAAPEK